MSGAATLILSMAWLLLALATVPGGYGPAAGRALHAVEWGLAIFAGLAFLGAETTARYQLPARLIAWEFLILLLVFGIVRRLAASPLERGYLLAALLATGVSLSAYAIYQYAVEFPRMRARFASPEALSQQVSRLNLNMPTTIHGSVAGWSGYSRTTFSPPTRIPTRSPDSSLWSCRARSAGLFSVLASRPALELARVCGSMAAALVVLIGLVADP